MSQKTIRAHFGAAAKHSNRVRVSRVRYRVSLRVWVRIRDKVRVIRLTRWHRGDTLNVWPKMPTYKERSYY